MVNPQKKTESIKVSDINDKFFGAVAVASNAVLEDLWFHLEATQVSSFPSLPEHLKDDQIRIFAQRFYRCPGSWVIAEYEEVMGGHSVEHMAQGMLNIKARLDCLGPCPITFWSSLRMDISQPVQTNCFPVHQCSNGTRKTRSHRKCLTDTGTLRISFPSSSKWGRAPCHIGLLRQRVPKKWVTLPQRLKSTRFCNHVQFLATWEPKTFTGGWACPCLKG